MLTGSLFSVHPLSHSELRCLEEKRQRGESGLLSAPSAALHLRRGASFTPLPLPPGGRRGPSSHASPQLTLGALSSGRVTNARLCG